jgi:ABC-type sugar transport system permease subunit
MGEELLAPRRTRSCFLLLLSVAAAAQAATEPQMVIKAGEYVVNRPTYPLTKAYNKYQIAEPAVKIIPFEPLRLQGALAGADSSTLMSFAGKTAPDVVFMQFHKLRAYARNNFIMDLSDFIGEDRDRDGYISDDETLWEDWKRLRAEVRSAGTIDGEPYGVPIGDFLIGLNYRKDILESLFEKSKIQRIPQDFDELFYLCQKATAPQLTIRGAKYAFGRKGLYLSKNGWDWLPWLWAAGGNCVEQGKQNPDTGKWHWYPKEEIDFIDPETGESLRQQPSRWLATFASEAGMEAMEFYWKLCHQPWILDTKLDPETNDYEPITLTEEDVDRGYVIVHEDRRIDFGKADVRYGVARGVLGGDDDVAIEMFARGETVFTYEQPIAFLAKCLGRGLTEQQIGFMPVPAGMSEDARPAFFWENQWLGINYQLKDNPEKSRVVFDILSYCSRNYTRFQVAHAVERNLGEIVRPDLLREFGYFEYLDEVPPHLAEAYSLVEKYARTEPYEGFWQPVQDLLIGGVIEELFASRDYDWRTGLKQAEEKANTEYLSKRPEEKMRELRKVGYPLFAIFAALVLGLFLYFFKVMREKYLSGQDAAALKRRYQSRGVFGKFAPLLMIGPAFCLIAMWAYYPMLKGSVMSFQDYRIVGESEWVGIDNFITVALSRDFYRYLLITFKYVFLSLAIGFVSPIFLSLLLNEVPRGKLFFRMVFLLPRVSVPLVITFLWKAMYHPTEAGFFNSALLKLGLIDHPLKFYDDPNIALLCCIIPSVWAGMGMGSLVYLAALKSVPDDLYEAAEMDGAGIIQRLWYVTLPTLKPLIVINFIGVCIHTFHSMGNIFVMTGGGPNGATTVLSLAIWRHAFVNLDFSMATATAWILGSLLIGFTIYQLKFLQKVEFRRAEIN